MAGNYKRVNVLLRPDQYKHVTGSGLSLSGLVRDLLDDRFSEKTIVISVTKETKSLYDNVISNFGVTDRELAGYMAEALDKFLQDKTKEIEKLRKKLQASAAKAAKK